MKNEINGQQSHRTHLTNDLFLHLHHIWTVFRYNFVSFEMSAFQFFVNVCNKIAFSSKPDTPRESRDKDDDHTV